MKIKSGAGGTWEEIGGVGVGVPAGGSTGQILTKTSAADYATAWGTNQPILANNTYLQGYKADGTTAQSLIGMTAADEISIGPSLAAGKNIYVPRLTVQGDLTLQNAQWIRGVGSGFLLGAYETGTFSFQIAYDVNANHNFAGGMTTFHRNVDVKGTLTKGAVAYVHPDHVFEHAYTGAIEQFREAHGAQDYAGLLPLDAVERHTRETLRLPGTRGDTYDLFARGDELLAEVEKLYLYAIQHEKRLAALEGR